MGNRALGKNEVKKGLKNYRDGIWRREAGRLKCRFN
jgi:hypothetical protein